MLVGPAERVRLMLELPGRACLSVHEDDDGHVLRVRHQPRFHLVPLVLKTPEYGRQSSAFVQAASELVEAAERRDQQAAPLAYVTLTLSCVKCHQYVARARVATLPGP